jgi:Flp pilus assembly protein TadG
MPSGNHPRLVMTHIPLIVGEPFSAQLDKPKGALSTTRVRRRLARLGGLAPAKGGNAAIEFALATPILIGLLVPVADIGMAFSQQIKVQQAAQAGAQYALLHGWDSASTPPGSKISNAVTAATTLASVSATPAPTTSCGCPSGTAITAATCSSTCSDGEAAGSYVFVNAQSAYTPTLPYSVFGSGVTLTAQAAVRIQ